MLTKQQYEVGAELMSKMATGRVQYECGTYPADMRHVHLLAPEDKYRTVLRHSSLIFTGTTQAAQFQMVEWADVAMAIGARLEIAPFMSSDGMPMATLRMSLVVRDTPTAEEGQADADAVIS